MKQLLKFLSTTVFALGLASTSACSGDTVCTAELCIGALALDLSQPLLPGSYKVEILSDGQLTRCDCQLGESSEGSCGGTVTLTSDKLAVVGEASRLNVEGKDPSRNVLAAQSYEPDYERDNPNDPC